MQLVCVTVNNNKYRKKKQNIYQNLKNLFFLYKPFFKYIEIISKHTNINTNNWLILHAHNRGLFKIDQNCVEYSFLTDSSSSDSL